MGSGSDASDRGRRKVRCRRISPTPAHPGKGLLSDHIAGFGRRGGNASRCPEAAIRWRPASDLWHQARNAGDDPRAGIECGRYPPMCSRTPAKGRGAFPEGKRISPHASVLSAEPLVSNRVGRWLLAAGRRRGRQFFYNLQQDCHIDPVEKVVCKDCFSACFASCLGNWPRRQSGCCSRRCSASDSSRCRLASLGCSPPAMRL